jgi:hypothetical protein
MFFLFHTDYHQLFIEVSSYLSSMGIAKTLFIAFLITLLIIRYVFIPFGESSYAPVLIISIIILLGVATYVWLKSTQ